MYESGDDAVVVDDCVEEKSRSKMVYECEFKWCGSLAMAWKNCVNWVQLWKTLSELGDGEVVTDGSVQEISDGKLYATATMIVIEREVSEVM